jgi:hypothetical protein
MLIPLIPPFASAYVLGRANVMASAIVVSFMIVSFVVSVGDKRTDTIKIFFSATEAAKLFTPRRALMLQQSSSIADLTRLVLLEVRWSTYDDTQLLQLGYEGVSSAAVALSLAPRSLTAEGAVFFADAKNPARASSSLSSGRSARISTRRPSRRAGIARPFSSHIQRSAPDSEAALPACRKFALLSAFPSIDRQ